MTAFQELVLNDPEVCNNCFGRVRRERSQTQSSTFRSDVSAEKSPYTRVETQTTVDHVPGETPSRSVAVFCECGTESAFDRIWEDSDDRCLTMRRLKDLLKSMVRTLEAKGVTLDRPTCIRLAIHYYRQHYDLNQAFEDALEAAIETAALTSRSSRSKTAVLSD